jgi:hypothetical protein
MTAFFSPTDWSQMEDRTETCNYLLMLIVNTAGKYVAKVGFRAKRDGDLSLKLANNADDIPDIIVKNNKQNDYLVILDCDIEFETSVEAGFVDRYEHVKKFKHTPVYKAKSWFEKQQEKFSKWGEDKSLGKAEQGKIEFGQKDDTWDEDDHWRDVIWDKDTHRWIDKRNKNEDPKDKPISQMTDKEWAEFQESEFGSATGGIDIESVKQCSSRDKYVMLNALLTGDTDKLDTAYPFDRLIKANKSTDKRDAFLHRLEDEFIDYFETLFPRRDATDMLSVLLGIKSSFEIFEIHSIFKLGVPILDKHIAECVEPSTPSTHY